jgi:hypothetical protein
LHDPGLLGLRLSALRLEMTTANAQRDGGDAERRAESTTFLVAYDGAFTTFRRATFFEVRNKT